MSNPSLLDFDFFPSSSFNCCTARDPPCTAPTNGSYNPHTKLASNISRTVRRRSCNHPFFSAISANISRHCLTTLFDDSKYLVLLKRFPINVQGKIFGIVDTRYEVEPLWHEFFAIVHDGLAVRRFDVQLDGEADGFGMFLHQLFQLTLFQLAAVRLIVFQVADRFCANLGNGSKVIDQFLLAHPNAEVLNTDGRARLIGDYSDVVVRLCFGFFWVCDRLIVDLVHSVRRIWNDFPKEDFLVGEESGDQALQLLDICIGCRRFSHVCIIKIKN